MELKWDDLRLFLAVHEQGSLSAAARTLKLGQPTLSRRMGELEAIVGEPLLTRQTHGITLTEAGQRLLPAAQRMAEWATEASIKLSNQTHTPSGKVRIAAVPSIAYLMAPFTAYMRRKHPTIQLEVMSSMVPPNLGRGEADIAIRLSEPSDPDLYCADSFSAPLRVHTSPSYAATLPERFGLADLDWICWAPPYDHLSVNQYLRKRIPGFKPAFTSDDFLVQVATCAAGLGAIMIPRYPAKWGYSHKWAELNIDLGEDAVSTVYLVCHKRHRYLPRVKVVLDSICEEFEGMRLEQHATIRPGTQC